MVALTVQEQYSDVGTWEFPSKGGGTVMYKIKPNPTQSLPLQAIFKLN